VIRLKDLLARLGAEVGTRTDEFDAETERMVLEFQRSRLLAPDRRVGRLTRIVLYGAAGGYPRPTLGENGGAS
jgi:peptidoglycan hydrolase-like protein with peptidoglycan-binding domain